MTNRSPSAPNRTNKRAIHGLVLGLAVTLSLVGAAPANPYAGISLLNPFRLQPITSQTSGQTLPPPVSRPSVKLTGLTDVTGFPLALLEVTEPAPGRSVQRLILREGEQADAVQVLAINLEYSRVTLRLVDVVTNLTFAALQSEPGATPGSSREPARPSTR